MNSKIENQTEQITISLNEKNQNTLKGLIAQRNHINQMINDVTTVILDAKDVDYQGKKVSISEDFTTINIIE